MTTVYACDHEQGALVFLMSAAAVLLYTLRRDGRKGLSPFQIVQLLVAVLTFLSVLLAPGNGARSRSEAVTWFAEYADYGFFAKLHLGLVHTFDMFFALPGLLMLVLTAVLLYVSYRSRGKTDIIVCLASIPLLLTVLYAYLVLLFPKLRLWFFSHHGEKSFDYGNMTTWFPVIFLVLWIGIQLKVMWDVEKDGWLFLIDVAVFLGGGMTTVGMGFSPTVYSSGSRTDVFLWFTLIYLGVRMLRRLCDAAGTEDGMKLLTWVGGILAFVEVGTKF